MKKSSHQLGFTLIELLVVILIVGLAMGIVAMNVGSGTDMMKLRNEARDFTNFTSLAIDEAIISGKTFGVDIYRDLDDDGIERFAYRYVAQNEQLKWFPVSIKDLPAEQFFGPAVSLKLMVEGTELTIGQRVDTPLPDEENTNLSDDTNLIEQPSTIPEIFIASSGEISPFKLHLEATDKDQRNTLNSFVKGDMLGRMQLRENDEEF